MLSQFVDLWRMPTISTRSSRLETVSQLHPTLLTAISILLKLKLPLIIYLDHGPHRVHYFQQLFYCCVRVYCGHFLPTAVVCFAVVSYQHVYMPHCSLLFVTNSLQAYRYFFFSDGCASDVCDRPRLSSLWLGCHYDYSPTAPAAPSLRPLV
jgi:hypothetical protein